MELLWRTSQYARVTRGRFQRSVEVSSQTFGNSKVNICSSAVLDVQFPLWKIFPIFFLNVSFHFASSAILFTLRLNSLNIGFPVGFILDTQGFAIVFPIFLVVFLFLLFVQFIRLFSARLAPGMETILGGFALVEIRLLMNRRASTTTFCSDKVFQLYGFPAVWKCCRFHEVLVSSFVCL